MPAGSIIAGIIALAGTTISAVGSGISAAEEEKERNRLAKLGQERWEAEKKQTDRAQNLQSVQTLADQRMGLQQKSFRRSFNKDFLRAVQFRQNQPRGPGVTTLGGR